MVLGAPSPPRYHCGPRGTVTASARVGSKLPSYRPATPGSKVYAPGSPGFFVLGLMYASYMNAETGIIWWMGAAGGGCTFHSPSFHRRAMAAAERKKDSVPEAQKVGPERGAGRGPRQRPSMCRRRSLEPGGGASKRYIRWGQRAFGLVLTLTIRSLALSIMLRLMKLNVTQMYRSGTVRYTHTTSRSCILNLTLPLSSMILRR